MNEYEVTGMRTQRGKVVVKADSQAEAEEVFKRVMERGKHAFIPWENVDHVYLSGSEYEDMSVENKVDTA